MDAQDNCSITPVISKSSADFIEGLVKDAESKGAKLCQPYKREGNLIWPVLVDHVTPVRPWTTCCHVSTQPARGMPTLMREGTSRAACKPPIASPHCQVMVLTCTTA